jgi:hypothetical protein
VWKKFMIFPCHFPVADPEIREILSWWTSDPPVGDFPPSPHRKSQAVTRITKAMSDKNPKAKRKAQAQHEMHKKQKAEELQREQQRLHEIHLMKHPHDPKG